MLEGVRPAAAAVARDSAACARMSRGHGRQPRRGVPCRHGHRSLRLREREHAARVRGRRLGAGIHRAGATDGALDVPRRLLCAAAWRQRLLQCARRRDGVESRRAAHLRFQPALPAAAAAAQPAAAVATAAIAAPALSATTLAATVAAAAQSAATFAAAHGAALIATRRRGIRQCEHAVPRRSARARQPDVRIGVPPLCRFAQRQLLPHLLSRRAACWCVRAHGNRDLCTGRGPHRRDLAAACPRVRGLLDQRAQRGR